MTRQQTVKPRPLVEALYTFGLIITYAAMAPVLLMIVFSSIAAAAQWRLDDTQMYATMKNALVLTEVLLVVGIPLLVAGYVVSLHPPVPSGSTKKDGTRTDEVQIPSDKQED